MLKADDFRLKNLTASDRWCEFGDLSEVEDARHLILNCPGTRNMKEQSITNMNTLIHIPNRYNVSIMYQFVSKNSFQQVWL